MMEPRTQAGRAPATKVGREYLDLLEKGAASVLAHRDFILAIEAEAAAQADERTMFLAEEIALKDKALAEGAAAPAAEEPPLITEVRQSMRDVVAVARSEKADIPAGWLNTIEQWEQLLERAAQPPPPEWNDPPFWKNATAGYKQGYLAGWDAALAAQPPPDTNHPAQGEHPPKADLNLGPSVAMTPEPGTQPEPPRGVTPALDAEQLRRVVTEIGEQMPWLLERAKGTPNEGLVLADEIVNRLAGSDE